MKVKIFNENLCWAVMTLADSIKLNLYNMYENELLEMQIESETFSL